MKFPTYILLALLYPFIVTAAFADSSSTTIINNNSSTNTQSSSSSCHTTVKTNVNGKEQDITKDDCGNVDIENGGTSVNVTNNSGNNSSDIQSPTEPPIPTHPTFYKYLPTIITP